MKKLLGLCVFNGCSIPGSSQTAFQKKKRLLGGDRFGLIDMWDHLGSVLISGGIGLGHQSCPMAEPCQVLDACDFVIATTDHKGPGWAIGCHR